MREAQIDKTPEGQVPVGGGWFILNLGEMAWQTIPGFGVWCGFASDDEDHEEGGGTGSENRRRSYREGEVAQHRKPSHQCQREHREKYL
jgi:hypothetical protein